MTLAGRSSCCTFQGCFTDSCLTLPLVTGAGHSAPDADAQDEAHPSTSHDESVEEIEVGTTLRAEPESGVESDVGQQFSKAACLHSHSVSLVRPHWI